MSEQYSDILNEIKDNDFFENVDINYKIEFMLKSINIIINESKNDVSKWEKIYNEYNVGYYNKAISEMCLNNINEALQSAENAKKYLSYIDVNNENITNYNMYKYNEEIMHINKLNFTVKQLSSQLLEIDKVVLNSDDTDSDNEKSDSDSE